MNAVLTLKCRMDVEDLFHLLRSQGVGGEVTARVLFMNGPYRARTNFKTFTAGSSAEEN